MLSFPSLSLFSDEEEELAAELGPLHAVQPTGFTLQIDQKIIFRIATVLFAEISTFFLYIYLYEKVEHLKKILS